MKKFWVVFSVWLCVWIGLEWIEDGEIGLILCEEIWRIHVGNVAMNSWNFVDGKRWDFYMEGKGNKSERGKKKKEGWIDALRFCIFENIPRFGWEDNGVLGQELGNVELGESWWNSQ